MNALEGEPMSELAEKALDLIGYSSDIHLASPLVESDVELADLVLTATKAIAVEVKEVLPQAMAKVYSLAEYAKLLETTGDFQDIKDPHGKDLETYVKTAKQIENYLKVIVDKVAE